jgi:GNAT superfamily N-acetyltransferase
MKRTAMPIRFALTDADIQNCFPIMAQLRPHLVEGEFVARVRQQEQDGYRLVLPEESGDVRAVSGFRTGESLSWGGFLYIDDSVTGESSRSHGFGQQLFDWIVDFAKANGCVQLHLDSGVQRFGAHRFYLTNRMDIAAHHFSLALG